MNMQDLQKKNTAELKNHITEKREELREIRFKASGSGMRNTNVMKNIRREIARSLTELTKRSKESTNGA